MMRIRVADDGTGIDQDRLMRTVVDGGHTTGELWQAMKLEERMQFLFRPGLSTTEEVSTTSGRGFGLDIVKSVIDGAGGQVAAHSEAGRGTIFKLRMPLSLSLTRRLLLVGGKHTLFGWEGPLCGPQPSGHHDDQGRVVVGSADTPLRTRSGADGQGMG